MADPQSLHKYLYAHANPVMYWDPSGKMSLALSMNFAVSLIGNLARMAVPSFAVVTNTIGATVVAILAYMAISDGTVATAFEMGRQQTNEIIDRARELQQSLSKKISICAAIDALEAGMRREYEPKALPGSYKVLFKQARKFMKCPGGNPNKDRGGPNK